MESLLKGLNAAQRAAVTSRASVLQVLAPPGSGKTKTLTSRVAYLLAHHGFAPRNVICCTFTLKASREMRERLRAIVGSDLESKLILGTFHSICRRYLVTYGYLIGLPKNFGIADSDDSLSILKRIQKRLKLSIDPKTARSRISHRKARGKRVDDIPVQPKALDAQEFATIFREYEDALRISNLLDYDDLLLRCVDLLRQHPECVANVEALLIDEFQDTNVVQFELMKLFASSKKRVTIVGDPDQSIYGFRSAEIENLVRMKNYYPETVVINLEENYRSSSAILDLAQHVIEQDLVRPNKKLKATHCQGTLPVLRRLPNPHEEALWIKTEIKRMKRMTGDLIQYSDMAILLRSAFLSLLIEKALANAGIPYRIVGGRRFFDRVEVRIVLDYLCVISHPDNNAALLSIINTPSRKIGETTVSELNRLAEEKKQSLWSVAQQVLVGKLNLNKKLSKAAETGLRDFVSLIKHARSKLDSFDPMKAPAELIELIVEKLQLESYLKKQYREDHEERWENVQELASQTKDITWDSIMAEDQLANIEGLEQQQIQSSHEVLTRFLANVALSTEVEADNPEDQPRVTISTIHSAKGLEWPVVFVPAIYEGSIPHSRAEDTDEERRLLYVAMTRAKALLYMTFPIMQSRNQSESILTQFLPADLHRRMAERGCTFDEGTINDIVAILRRQQPSQEAIIKGMTAFSDNESQYDDIWPSDGSHRRSNEPLGEIGTEWSHTLLQQGGQSLAEALHAQKSVQQKRDFSTLTSFTTASHQMSMMSNQCQTVMSEPHKEKAAENHGDISAFFKNGSLTKKPATVPATSKPTSRQPSTIVDDRPRSIPLELSSHRLPSSTANSLASSYKRPRVVLEETSPNQHVKKRHYVFLSSSPTREDHEAKTTHPGSENPSNIGEPEDSNVIAANTDELSKRTILYTTTTAKLNEAKHNSISQLQSRSNGSTSIGARTYMSGMLNTLSKPAPLQSMQANDRAEAGQTVRKTLGVRRTMTGWADRKHK